MVLVLKISLFDENSNRDILYIARDTNNYKRDFNIADRSDPILYIN